MLEFSLEIHQFTILDVEVVLLRALVDICIGCCGIPFRAIGVRKVKAC